MKTLLIPFAALALAFSSPATEPGKDTRVLFSDLPYSEGKLYVALSCGEEPICAVALDVEADALSFTCDLSACQGRELLVRAFQDLNDNATLDLDQYGRPTEPCLSTTVRPQGDEALEFKLIQY